ncbi:MAG: hypothetical protein Q9227_007787 [Pyrenula ochraceoflavens]
MSDQSSSDQPSMLSSHIKYAQGAISSAFNNPSGEQTKSEAVQEMKAASQQSSAEPKESGILGSVEKKAGELTGCEGMVDEGQKRMPEEGEKSA